MLRHATPREPIQPAKVADLTRQGSFQPVRSSGSPEWWRGLRVDRAAFLKNIEEMWLGSSAGKAEFSLFHGAALEFFVRGSQGPHLLRRRTPTDRSSRQCRTTPAIASMFCAAACPETEYSHPSWRRQMILAAGRISMGFREHTRPLVNQSISLHTMHPSWPFCLSADPPVLRQHRARKCHG